MLSQPCPACWPCALILTASKPCNTPCNARALSQLLLVLSDDDLHVKDTPFGTGVARAIATSLNALVYHTHFPRQQQQQRPQQQVQIAVGPLPAATLLSGVSILERYAPVALRGLYERDQRRSFCQAALWTAPYDVHSQSSGGAAIGMVVAQQPQAEEAQAGGSRPVHQGLRAAAAVVQGLLFGGGSGEGGGAGGAGGGGQPSAVAPVGSPTAAMTALLRSAPQCVPFDVRLQLFRYGS